MRFHIKAAAVLTGIAAATGMAFSLIPTPADEPADNISIVTTIFPAYDWLEQILGEEAEHVSVRLLTDGRDIHSYQPSAQDIVEITGSDLFIYVGGESDGWVRDVLKDAPAGDRIDISLVDVLGDAVREEETVPGMEEEETEDGEEAVPDEHVWLSLKNADLFAGEIDAALGRLDPEHADVYDANTKAYTDKLSDLDRRFEEAVAEAPLQTLVFADRFPFLYLMKDYGLDYYAAFAGCSSETEASFETVIFLADKVDEIGTNVILTIDGGDQSLAKTVRDAAKAKTLQILVMNSMQSAPAKEDTYLSVMEQNLEILKTALGE